jgi:ADP-dependent NAD(P)H-hydrate dehydratase / NAD(P)H-hydrate epimerase
MTADAPLLTRDEVRAVDRALIRAGVAGVILMENAGRGAAEEILRRAPDAKRVTVLVGPGNNGGDGLVVARHLVTNRPSAEVTVACIVDPSKLTGDAAAMRDAWFAVGGTISLLRDVDDPKPLLEDRDVVVDALFGTGLSRPLEGVALRCVESIASVDPAMVVALDLPSGLDADTGATLGPRESTVRAHLTCTFAAGKPGLFTGEGRVRAGDVVVIGLGAPVPAEIRSKSKIALSHFALPSPRSIAAHKGAAGRVLIVGGSPGKVGAALLTAKGAHRGGAGLVTVASRAASHLDARVVETMTATLADDAFAVAPSLIPAVLVADAIVVGPGLGLDEHAEACLDAVLRHATGPVVIDADGLTALAKRGVERVSPSASLVLTPHPLELARLLGLEVSRGAEIVNADRIQHARDAATRFDAIVVLKGAGTIVARPDGEVRVMPYAEPVLGVGGSGDVLGGVIAARLAEGDREGITPWTSVLCGVHAHARAGQRVREAMGGVRGALASEIADQVPAALAGL